MSDMFDTLPAYMVFKHHDQNEDNSGMMSKTPTSKFLGKARSGNSQYTSTNSSLGGLEHSRYTEQDVQEEFLRLYTQLELLKEKNMRVGNRHLASKITAMQDAARSHDHKQGERMHGKVNTLCVVPEKSGDDVNSEETVPIKTKRQSVSFVKETEVNGDPASKACEKIAEEVADSDKGEASESSVELKCKEDNGSDAGDRNGRQIKSGHARTHAIVINLDDKSRFTEEVTV